MGVLMTWMREGAQVQMRNPVPDGRDRVGEVLAEWFEHERSYRPKLGFERRGAAGRYRISRQWDEADVDYETDSELVADRARVVAECIDRLAPHLRAAIYTEMRNRSGDADTRVRNVLVGASVFRNPRVAEVSRSDFEAAIALLVPMLVAKGLVDKSLASASNRA
ncbi:hypothetical protein K6L27_05165 [Burkholderia cenocepacia]|uniref:hypothetical protein n=1 Tax=Burkholderia cenocepacia TaxID=95486 RepID=UPI00222F2B7D|nr:hypothetical protein [Burkholderia cenocepacia]MCW3657557.1 hypothetical protein [Burkholderia cenocepacia]